MSRRIGVLGLVFLVWVGSPALANTRGGVSMSDSDKVESTALVLNGMGIRQATVFNVDVYVAGLYLEKKSSDGQEVIRSEQHKKLLLHFVREVEVDDLNDAFEAGFEKSPNFGALKARVATLCGWMGDMKVGDRMALTYLPKKGMVLEVKGKRKGVIEGADFAQALFTIFLGPTPPNSDLKQGMLGAR